MNRAGYTRRDFLKIAGLGTAGLALAGHGQACNRLGKRQPNIVIIFTDDQGYADVGVFGAKGFKILARIRDCWMNTATGQKFRRIGIVQRVSGNRSEPLASTAGAV